ncbi:TPA: MurR/RpiR family transcriptional regulator [Staphylococcus aureus]
MTNILYRIDKQLSDFTKTEKIIADYILKNPHKIIDMTVNDLADVTNVSTASIVRFSRKMTHQGFQELKIAISRYLPEDIATNPHLELIENESVETLKNKMIARATNTMRFVATNIMDAQIDAICDVLKNARTIFLFGFGASSLTIGDLFQKLSRIGLNVRLLHETHLLVSTFATNQGSHSELQSIAQVATHYSIPIITISSTANNPVAQIADYALIYGRTDENEMRMAATTSLFAQLFTVDILYYRFVALNYHAILDCITQSKMALDNYRKHLATIDFKH